MKTIIVIPTYNERENIQHMIDAVLSTSNEADILVVDDNSPDKTSEVVRNHSAFNQRVHLLLREKKQGLGKAYLAGFRWCLEKGYEWIVEMDADFSHRPKDLGIILENKEPYDFCIGSRWVPGGGTQNWGLIRKIISRGGSFYARMILGYPVRDWTGGFNFWRSKVLKGIQLDTIESEGYSFQIELKYRAFRNGFNGAELPILFEERRAGQSKMSMKIVFEALLRVWSIRLKFKPSPQ